MYLKLKENKQKELITRAIEKAGSYRKLSKIIGVPRSSLNGYLNQRLITEERLNLLLEFLEIENKEDLVSERLADNWKQIKGGKKCVEVKKKNGTFEGEMKKWQNFQAKKLKKWHRLMKKKEAREYHLIQYSRFKKIAEYKYITNKGEKVRNILEKDVADLLYKLKVDYEYEPLINIKKRYFFPDFLINDRVIIECTMWKGEEKAYKLKDKIKFLENKYKVYVVIPKTLYSFYEILNNHLILGLDELVPVAQTFLKH